MKLETPANANYAATVVRVNHLVKLENADRLLGLPLFGLQAIVGLDTKVGDLGVFFPAEVQLSFDYAFHNSLHSHATKGDVQLNADPAAKGYLGDNRRVRAITLRGNRSDALFMPLSSLAYLGVSTEHASLLHEGDTFDTIDGHEICKKYVIQTRGGMATAGKKKLEVRVDARVFPEQFEVAQYFRVDRSLDPNAFCYVTQKLHGTSIRIGNVPVKRSLGFLERVARRVGVKVKEFDFDMVYGSHHVVKDANNPRQQHFYDEDLWSEVGHRLDGLIPQNYIVYAEVIGWTAGGAPIQKNYTYGCLPGTRSLHVYRVAIVNEQGTVADLSWHAVKEFCRAIGVEHVPELWKGYIRQLQSEGGIDSFLDAKFFGPDEYEDDEIMYTWSNAVPLAPESPCDEGVCIRIDDGLIPTIVKAKSPMFLRHETAVLDEGVADIESTEVTPDA